MDNISCLKLVSFPIQGLSNQLYSLVGTIITSYKNNKNILIVDNFLKQIWTYDYTPITNVLDLKTTNIFLKKYNITLIDSNYIDFKVVKILFGTENKKVDITNFILNNCFKDNILTIRKNIELLKIKGDPHENVEKKIYLHYQLSNQNFCNVYDEMNGFLKTDVILDFNNLQFQTCTEWKTNDNLIEFNDILKNLVFNPIYYSYANEFLKKMDSSKKINVIHLRIESDGIQWWSNQNSMPAEKYQALIECKYISLIKKYINIYDNTIILCADTNNKVIDFLKNNNYQFFIHNKDSSLGREINALIDLCIGENCNNIFLAPIKCSTFSYTLKNRLKTPINTVSFSMNNITQKPEIEIDEKPEIEIVEKPEIEIDEKPEIEIDEKPEIEKEKQEGNLDLEENLEQ